MILTIKNDFSRTPGPRYKDEGDYSGQEFREQILLPAIEKAIEDKEKLCVNLDGTEGYGTSFLEEAFGGLIRSNRLGYESIIQVLELISDEEPYLIDDIFHYLEEAKF